MKEGNSQNDRPPENPMPESIPEYVSDTTQMPYKFTGILTITFPNGNKYTGTAILLGKENTTQTMYALTCARNLYNAKYGGQAIDLEFTRAYNGGISPFETIQAINFYYPDNYVDPYFNPTDKNFDFGLIKLSKSVSTGDKLPFLSVQNQLFQNNIQINGYDYLNKTMTHATGSITHLTDNSLYYPIAVMEGTAGAAIMPVASNKEIVGIHSHIIKGDETNKGVRITENVKKIIEQWME